LGIWLRNRVHRSLVIWPGNHFRRTHSAAAWGSGFATASTAAWGSGLATTSAALTPSQLGELTLRPLLPQLGDLASRPLTQQPGDLASPRSRLGSWPRAYFHQQTLGAVGAQPLQPPPEKVDSQLLPLTLEDVVAQPLQPPPEEL
jgi:hypothetical protein